MTLRKMSDIGLWN